LNQSEFNKELLTDLIKSQAIDGKPFFLECGIQQIGKRKRLLDVVAQARKLSKFEVERSKGLNILHLAPSSFKEYWRVGRGNGSLFRVPVELMCPIFHNFKDILVKSQVIEGIAFNVEKLAKEMQKRFSSDFKAFRELSNEKFSLLKVYRRGVITNMAQLFTANRIV
jgi:hypothetical protein